MTWEKLDGLAYISKRGGGINPNNKRFLRYWKSLHVNLEKSPMPKTIFNLGVDRYKGM